jgi:crotonobetainyl-CoA:carnitine CoA-transferase CaiB-like acyl-CoA transferase
VTGLLEGVRVLDLSRVLAGPFTAQVMAEMGADVIKVEFPGGDPARAIGPFLDGRSLYFSSLNTGKRGVLVDPATDAGREALEALIARSDVLVENFRPSTGKQLGLDPPGLLERHRRLVLVSVTGYARDSDRADEGAFDLSIQAETGIMGVTGEPGRPPVRAGVAISDLAAALWAAMGGIAALRARDRDGRGRHVEIPMIDASLPLLSYLGTGALGTGEEPDKVGSGHHSLCPYGAYAAKDGWVAIACLADKFWPPLCRSLELDDLLERPELVRIQGRLVARHEVDGRVADAVARLRMDEVLTRLANAGVPHAPVLGVIEALTTPYVRTRGIVGEVGTPEGAYQVVQGPLRIASPPRPAPALGEHTLEVLTEALGDNAPIIERVLAETRPTGDQHRPPSTPGTDGT